MSVPKLTSLLKQSEITDHEEILAAASATLKTNKNDIDAQHVKGVALLKLDRFQDAVQAFEAGGEKLKERATLEYAYALYKSGRRKEASEIAHSTTSRGLQHVEAQALYSLEEFLRASELYKSLSQEVYDDNVADLRVNTLAANAQLQWNNLGQHVEEKAMTRGDFEAHETVYNTACGSIARGELGQCEVLLTRARSLCENLQDLSEEDKATELLPIILQQIYVLTRLGKVDEARQLVGTLDASEAMDDLTRYLVEVNSQAAQLDTANPYLLERQLQKHLDGLDTFAFQKAVLTRNHYALNLGAKKYPGTIKSTQAEMRKQPAGTTDAVTNTLSVINAAAHGENRVGKQALKHIAPLMELRPDDIGLVLTVVQLHILASNPNCAIELLEVLSTASHWTNHSEDLTPGATHLLKAAGSALLESQDNADHVLAKEIFGKLYDGDNFDKYAAAGLLAASAHSSIAVDRSSLTPFEKLTTGINAEELEYAGLARRSTAQPTAGSRKRQADSEIQRTKPRKLRKSKTPKDFDPTKTPDPERWLPLRDRSTYRPKGKKGKARQAMLSQGAVTGGDSDNSRSATPGAEVMKAKTGQAGGGYKKKKQSKGKK
ncbi:hypothetical protein AMS68_005858 [Peltaster fructicola]|uniref:Signal recognition particle subunit SRP72 n=1 Tax=Peltaster fructicola TaxID=286661 RepID=A0A6H0Y093_9PEZI|nr:hypothetical protein AMS68_005858 [Peltaster fructicola]